jgi:hypothetical protein
MIVICLFALDDLLTNAEKWIVAGLTVRQLLARLAYQRPFWLHSVAALAPVVLRITAPSLESGENLRLFAIGLVGASALYVVGKRLDSQVGDNG